MAFAGSIALAQRSPPPEHEESIPALRDGALGRLEEESTGTILSAALPGLLAEDRVEEGIGSSLFFLPEPGE